MSAINTLSVDMDVALPPVNAPSRAKPATAYALHIYNDPDIQFETYLHYAEITRAEEREHERNFPNEKRTSLWGSLVNLFKDHRRTALVPTEGLELQSALEKTEKNEKHEDGKETVEEAFDPFHNQVYSHPSEVSDAEWKALSRGIRTVSWSTCFYLITSDIIGPFGTAWSFAQLGYGPGIALYIVFGGLSGVSGFYIWRIFIQMDSDRFPLRDYGAAFFRIFGPWSRHAINAVQSIQMILTLASLVLGMGQSIAQISEGTSKPVCFVICLLIFTLIGIVLGQIRTLQKLGWLSNFAVWMNLVAVFIAMGIAANWPPNFAATEASFGPNFAEGPIHTYAGFPPADMASGGVGLIATMNGVNQAVYGFAGAILFFNFLAEMRHPWDFWKSLLCAQVFIFVCYLFVGLFIYSYQGQYTFNPVQQGISQYGYQTAANICYIMTGFIAAAMYGNIGIKIVYSNVCQEILGWPPLTVRRGKIIWVAMVPAYWALAFVIGASIPQFTYVSGLLSAVCMLTFTYSFPALLALGFRIKKGAMLPEETFDEVAVRYHRADEGLQRWIRGFRANLILNTWDVVYFLGSLAAAALGTYAAIEGLIDSFSGDGVITSWSCTAPV